MNSWASRENELGHGEIEALTRVVELRSRETKRWELRRSEDSGAWDPRVAELRSRELERSGA